MRAKRRAFGRCACLMAYGLTPKGKGYHNESGNPPEV